MSSQSHLDRDLTLGLIQPKPASHVNGNIMLSQSKHQRQTSCTKAIRFTYAALTRNFAHIQPCKSTLVTFPTPLAVGAQPLFTFKDGSPLTRHSCLKHLRRFLHKAGYLPQDFNTHSFRIGAATSAAHSGLPVHQIKLLGRWKRKAYCRYIRSRHPAKVAAKTFATSSLRK